MSAGVADGRHVVERFGGGVAVERGFRREGRPGVGIGPVVEQEPRLRVVVMAHRRGQVDDGVEQRRVPEPRPATGVHIRPALDQPARHVDVVELECQVQERDADTGVAG